MTPSCQFSNALKLINLEGYIYKYEKDKTLDAFLLNSKVYPTCFLDVVLEKIKVQYVLLIFFSRHLSHFCLVNLHSIWILFWPQSLRKFLFSPPLMNYLRRYSWTSLARDCHQSRQTQYTIFIYLFSSNIAQSEEKHLSNVN